MSLFKKKQAVEERRQFIRIDSIFPVQFRLLSLDGKHFLSEWLQGFTNNIGKGGLCLNINNLNPDLGKIIENKQAKFSLDIETPVTRIPIGAQANIAWVRIADDEPNKYCIGLSYEDINKEQNSRIVRYAWTKKLFLPMVLSIIVVLGSGSVVSTVFSAKLIKGNKILIEQLIKILQESSVAKQKVKEINKNKQDLQVKLQALQARIQNVEEEKQKLEPAMTEEAKTLNSLIDSYNQEKDGLEQQLLLLERKESTITENLLRLDKRKMALEKTNLDKMYRWLKTHQNLRTGLVSSFEGDDEISNLAYLDDQALAALAFTYFSDSERVRLIFNFFQKKAKTLDGSFLNTYYVRDGNVAEYAVYSGSNIWLGIAIADYIKKTHDNEYRNLLEEIAGLLVYLQQNDKHGAIPTGPNTGVYSVEDNLNAYAFFDIMYKLTAKPQYQDARDKVLNWLSMHAREKLDITSARAERDPTSAVDTFAWSIAAIGPQKLEDLGLIPDRIMEFTEENCAASASYVRPSGEVIKMKGYDFAITKNGLKPAIVSCESTARMAMLFNIMTDSYYRKEMIAKARAYESKADMCLADLANMITVGSTPTTQGENSLPYATKEHIDTGHGWMTPKGHSTGSLSATVYTLFAYYKYNPLESKE